MFNVHLFDGSGTATGEVPFNMRKAMATLSPANL